MNWIRKRFKRRREQSRAKQLSEAMPVLKALHEEGYLTLSELVLRTRTNAIYVRTSLKFLDRHGLIRGDHDMKRRKRFDERYTLKAKGLLVVLGKTSLN